MMEGACSRRRTVTVAVLAALCIWLTGVAVVLAHARYDHSTPSPEQVLQASPAQVDIFTAQDMQKVSGTYGITVTRNDTGNSGGQEVDTGNTTIDDANHSHFFVGLQPNLPRGRYLVSFHNVSDVDGDADHGQFAFYIGNGPTAAQQALDKNLRLSAADTATSSSSSHTGLLIGIVVGVVVVLLILGVSGLLLQRHGRPAA